LNDSVKAQEEKTSAREPLKKLSRSEGRRLAAIYVLADDGQEAFSWLRRSSLPCEPRIYRSFYTKLQIS
jgi:hypothetical protein